MEYFKAYSLRLEKNHNSLVKLSKDLVTFGADVYIPKKPFISFIKIVFEGRQLVVGFAEVPYRWYFSIPLVPSKHQGSSRTVFQTMDYDREFTVEECFTYLQEYPFKETDFSYLTKFIIDEHK